MAGTKRSVVLVFVHGWSVTNTDTYGGLPARLRNEAAIRQIDLTIKHLFLGRYISFHDEVTIADIARAFQAAVGDELGKLVNAGHRFACITHSTGGPVIRDWWNRFYASVPRSGVCPMSHLLMLAPANYGSALAQLGKGRISRLKNWFGGTEPGQGVLDWLELGSAECWDLNSAWIKSEPGEIGAKGIFPFVLTGQTIDRKFYDNLNTYTGESGTDGVIRVAAANLNGRIVNLKQQAPKKVAGSSEFEAPLLEFESLDVAPMTALCIIGGASHSGAAKGIMRSVKKKVDHSSGRALVDALFECLLVSTPAQYRKVAEKQERETNEVQYDECLEIEDRLMLSDTCFIHDRYSMVVFRVTDDYGHAVNDFDLVLTAGENDDPNHLPKGFFVDRQRNHVCRNTVTYYLNYDVMVGAPEIKDNGKVIRAATTGVSALGCMIKARPDDGFVHYLPCRIRASSDLMRDALKPNSTTLVDIRLRRIVRKNVFRASRMQGDKTANNFKKTRPGDEIVN
jgi:hypothetical protein